jgi:Tol biopolymer transport system component
MNGARRCFVFACWLILLIVLVSGCRQAPRLDWPGARLVFTSKRAWLRDPAWSPDGTQVAVIEPTDQHASEHGYVVDVQAGTVITTFGESFGWLFDLHWSADGRWLAYSKGCNYVRILDLTLNALTTSMDACAADWAGSDTAFAVYHQGTLDSEPATVSLRSADGGTNAVLFSDSSPYNERLFGGLAWSDASQGLVFSAGALETDGGPLTPNRDVYVAYPEGEGTISLRATPADEFDPSWSPDGEWLVYLSIPRNEFVKDGPADVTIVFDRADRTCTLPALSQPELIGVDWSPGGRELAITVGTELYVVDIATAFGDKLVDSDAECAASLLGLEAD